MSASEFDIRSHKEFYHPYTADKEHQISNIVLKSIHVPSDSKFHITNFIVPEQQHPVYREL